MKLRPLVLASLVVPLAGCGFPKSLVGKNTVDLEGAEVKSMGVDIRPKAKAGVLLDTGSSYARDRAKKQLVFFRDRSDAADTLEALRGSSLLRGPG